ncbi:MAG: class I SAM-dependent methyltransferase [Firmicutes bacterium]|nr:class I SAM-dependent methyltransferase [Bacillota bacterium]
MSKHKFDPKRMAKLDSLERRKILPPEKVLQHFGIQEGWSVADIGCGVGYFSLPISSMLGENGTLYALDIEDVMVQETQKRAEAKGRKNIISLQSKENILPLDSDILDAALMVFLYHELKQPELFIEEVLRVLKVDGLLYIVDWKKKKTDKGPPVDHRISEEEVTSTLKQNGFIVEEVIDLSDALYGVRAIKNVE